MRTPKTLCASAPLVGQKLATIEAIREHVGIGAALAVDPITKAIWITKILPDSPAARAGLSAGLLIQKVGDVSVIGKTPEQCTALIRGQRGTTVRLELNDPKDQQTRTIELTRGNFRTGEG